MIKKIISIPIVLPFGVKNLTPDWQSKKFNFKINDLRELSKHKETRLEFFISINIGHIEYNNVRNLEHKGLLITPLIVAQYLNVEIQKTHKFTLSIQFITDIESISNEYSAPTDIYSDIISGICLYMNACLNTLTFAKLSPIIFDDKKIIFNERMAYLVNPGQDWFRSYEMLTIVLDNSLKGQINSTAKRYDSILPHVRDSAIPLCLENLSNLAEIENRAIKYLHRYGRVLSEITRMHPSYDYSAIVGLLTALIEGFLLINGENRYKFKIRITNLLNDSCLGGALTHVYDSRSNFFHSGEYEKINDIFHFLTIDFLLLVLNKIINFQIFKEIKQETFDYPISTAIK